MLAQYPLFYEEKITNKHLSKVLIKGNASHQVNNHISYSIHEQTGLQEARVHVYFVQG